MLHTDGFEVRIKCLDRDEYYDEYFKPDATINPSNHTERFIAVKAGERFAFDVEADEDLMMMAMEEFDEVPDLKIRTTIDQGTCSHVDYMNCEELIDEGFERVVGKQTINDRVYRAGFMFGELDLEEDSIYDEDQTERLAQTLGRLHVSIRVGKHKWKSAPKTGSGSWLPSPQPAPVPKAAYKPPQASTTASIKLVKKEGITNGVRPVLDGAMPVPAPTPAVNGLPRRTKKFVPCMAARTFTFHYRSLATFKKLGMVLEESNSENSAEKEDEDVMSTPTPPPRLETTESEILEPPAKRMKLETKEKQDGKGPSGSGDGSSLPRQGTTRSNGTSHQPLPFKVPSFVTESGVAHSKKRVYIDLTED